ncbi:glutamate--cysteine ligase, partial [Klebsiella oxytoca]
VLADAPEMNAEELACCRANWNNVILEGRKPGQVIGMGCGERKEPLAQVGKALFADLQRVAKVLDSCSGTKYLEVCLKLEEMFDNPQLTFSGRLLEKIKAQGIGGYGLSLAEEYHQQLVNTAYEVLTDDAFEHERISSIKRQADLEKSDTISFDEYLKLHAG